MVGHFKTDDEEGSQSEMCSKKATEMLPVGKNRFPQPPPPAAPPPPPPPAPPPPAAVTGRENGPDRVTTSTK